jgi:hypothetical protein
MNQRRTRLLLQGLSNAMGYDPSTLGHPNAWQVRDESQEGWIILQPLAEDVALVVARFPICMVPQERRGTFFKRLLRLNMRTSGFAAIALDEDGAGVWSLSYCDPSFTEDPNAFSRAVSMAALGARVAREEIAPLLVEL